MRVYRKAVNEARWASVEDYLPAGNALGYGWNWRFAYSGGELLMMGVSGEPNGYYPMDSNGVWVQSHLPSACACLVVPTQVATCDALGYGECEGGRCEEGSPPTFLILFGVCIPTIQMPPWVIDLRSCLEWCKELDDRCRRNAEFELR